MKRAFISFDYDHDQELKHFLVGQSRHPDTDFEIADHSIKEASSDWKSNARQRIRRCDVVVVICGEYTHTAQGVAIELSIAQEESKRYFLLYGRGEKVCFKPTTALPSDVMYKWTWDNLKILINGGR